MILSIFKRSTTLVGIAAVAVLFLIAIAFSKNFFGSFFSASEAPEPAAAGDNAPPPGSPFPPTDAANPPWWCVKECPKGMYYSFNYETKTLECLKSNYGTPGTSPGGNDGNGSGTASGAGTKSTPGSKSYLGYNPRKPVTKQGAGPTEINKLVFPGSGGRESKFKILTPLRIKPGSSGTKGQTGGVVGSVSIPVDPDKIPPKPQKTYLYAACECGEKSVAVSLPKELGGGTQTFDCSVHYGDSVQYNVSSTTVLDVHTLPEYACEEKWSCPAGYKWNWWGINQKCDPWKLAQKNKTKACNGQQPENLDAETYKVCQAFNYNISEGIKNAKQYYDSIACISQTDCQKYQDIMKAGKAELSTKAENGMTFEQIAGSCSSLYPDSFDWTLWYPGGMGGGA